MEDGFYTNIPRIYTVESLSISPHWSKEPITEKYSLLNAAVKGFKINNDDCDVLSKILRFAGESDDNKKFLANKEEFIRMLVDLISPLEFRNISDFKLMLIEEAVKILSMIRRKIIDQRTLSNLILTNGRDCLTAFFLLIKSGNLEVKIDCFAVLEFIAVDAESKLLIAKRNGLLAEVLKSINQNSDSKLIKASLSFLTTIASPKRVKLALIGEKLVPKLTMLLSTDPTSSVAMTEKCLKLLESLSSCKEIRSEICDGMCLETVIKNLMKMSTTATENAVTILWRVSYLLREEKAQNVVIKTNGVTKILLLLQSNCSLTVRQMLTDLLKVFKVNLRFCLSVYETKTTHIMPF